MSLRIRLLWARPLVRTQVRMSQSVLTRSHIQTLLVVAGQLAGRKGAIVANANLVKVAIAKGLKHYMLAPLPRGKGAKKRAELGLTVSPPPLPSLPQLNPF